jgi:predicted nucleic acid-binding protein
MAANGYFGDAEPKGSRAAHLNGRFEACFVGDVVISAVTLAELQFGIACSSLAVQATNQSRRAAR